MQTLGIFFAIYRILLRSIFLNGRLLFCYFFLFYFVLYCIQLTLSIDRLSTGTVVGAMMEARRCGRKRTLSYWNISDIFLLSFFHPVTISRE